MEAGDIGLAVMFLIWAGLLTMPYWIRLIYSKDERAREG